MGKDNYSVKNLEGVVYNFNHSILPPFPKKDLLIELSNICNHRCIFCANKKMHRKIGYMDFEFLTRILQEAHDNGTKEVGFYATGEPFMYPKLADAIKKAKEIGFEYVYITTNGALLNEEKIKSVFDAGLDSIKFSINAASKETYKLIHGRDDFEKVISNLKRVYEYREENNLNYKIFISFVITKYTQNEAPEFKEKYGKFCDNIAFFAVCNQAGLNSEINKLLTLDKNYNLVDVVKNGIVIPCYRVFNGLTVSYEGYLTACCVDYENQLIIADLNKTSLKDAWECKKFQDFRQMHLEKNVKNTMCQNCFNYSQKPFEPLSSEYAIPIDFKELYNSEPILSRIKEYEAEIKK